MDSEIERIVVHYYPQRTLSDPLRDRSVRWDYDRDWEILKAVLADLGSCDTVRPGTRSDPAVGEELIVGERVRLQVSYLGPFAAIDHGPGSGPVIDDDERALLVQTIRDVLADHGIRVLSPEELDEAVPWIRHGPAATVWRCLFTSASGGAPA